MADDNVIEMGLCEVEHVMLRPNVLYRFVVMPDCSRCKELAAAYEVPNKDEGKDDACDHPVNCHCPKCQDEIEENY